MEKKDKSNKKNMCDKEAYSWAEIVLCGDDGMVAIASSYGRIPEEFRIVLDKLVFTEYMNKIFIEPLLQLSHILIFCKSIPRIEEKEYHDLKMQAAKLLFAFHPPSIENRDHFDAITASLLENEKKRGAELVAKRTPDDIVVAVFRDSEAIATMSLFPFKNKTDIPSRIYLDVDEYAEEHLPDAQGVEVGRMARKTRNGLVGQKMEFSYNLSWAMAFAVADFYILAHGLVDDENSYICGDTHGNLLSKLERIFNIKKFCPRLNYEMLDNRRDYPGLSMYFTQRRVLGQFLSAEELLAVLEGLCRDNPVLGRRVRRYLVEGMARLGLKRAEDFIPELFKLFFFHFKYRERRTQEIFANMKRLFRQPVYY